jgi:hypothetical protein
MIRKCTSCDAWSCCSHYVHVQLYLCAIAVSHQPSSVHHTSPVPCHLLPCVVVNICVPASILPSLCWLQGRLAAAEGRASELEGQLALLTAAQQQLGARLAAMEGAVTAAAADVREVRDAWFGGSCCQKRLAPVGLFGCTGSNLRVCGAAACLRLR